MISTHTYTNYCHETVRFCYSKTFIQQKISLKQLLIFLVSKLVIFGMHFAKSIAFHHIYTIGMYTTYQLQSSRKNKTWIFERVYLVGLFIFTNLRKFILAKLKNFCVLVKLYFPQLKQSMFFFCFFLNFWNHDDFTMYTNEKKVK